MLVLIGGAGGHGRLPVLAATPQNGGHRRPLVGPLAPVPRSLTFPEAAMARCSSVRPVDAQSDLKTLPALLLANWLMVATGDNLASAQDLNGSRIAEYPRSDA